MKKVVLKSWDELLDAVQSERFDRSSYIFRGVSNSKHNLRPKIGRIFDGQLPYTSTRRTDRPVAAGPLCARCPAEEALLPMRPGSAGKPELEAQTSGS